MISRQIVATLAFFSGPGLASCRPLMTWASRSGRNTGEPSARLISPTSLASAARRFSSSRSSRSTASISTRSRLKSWPISPGPRAGAVSADSPSAGLASFSTMRCSPLSLEPSSRPISVTPWVARPSSRISLTRVRTSTPLSVISMISSSACTSVAATTLPLRSLCWMAIMPLVPRPWRVYSVIGVRLP